MASLSAADKTYLSEDQQKQISALKDAYAAATSDAQREEIHQQAEAIRANAGYSGGDSGNGYTVLDSQNGGKTAAEMAQALADYRAANSNFDDTTHWGDKGWTNGYDTATNVRSMANMVRQQMEANSKAWHDADESTKTYLHEQNVALAGMLPKGTTKYNEDLGRWETYNPNVGYGYNMNGTQENIRNAWKNYYGYTDDQIENWAKDTSHYYNFVDTRAAARNSIDESSGFTGQYAQFANGPYASLLSPGAFSNTNVPWVDTIGDGFGDEGTFMKQPQYDAYGNIIKTAPALKNNNSASAYTRQFLPTAVNGVLAGHGEKVDAMDPTTGDTNVAGQKAYYENYGRYANGGGSLGAGSGGYEGYLQQLYDSALQSQLAQLEASYNQNVSDLDANVGKVNDTYTEQKRQTTGTNAQEAAAWREMANAIGLNTGAIGQAALAQNNQLQSNLNTLESAEASALTEIERQRVLLGQQYQLQINQAISENNFQKAQALYEEAVRAEQQLMQQQQFASQMALQYAQLAQNQYQYENDLALQYAKAGLLVPGSGDTGDYIPVPEPEAEPGGGGDFTPITSDKELTSEAYKKYVSWIPYYAKTSDRVTIGMDIKQALDSGAITDADGLFMLRQFGIDPKLYGYSGY